MRAGLLNLRHLPYVGDNLVQLPQTFGFYPNNDVVKAVGNGDFGNFFCFPDFLGCVVLLAAFHHGNHVGFYSLRRSTLPLNNLFLKKSLSVFKRHKVLLLGARGNAVAI
jgi:hypothetical protein